MIACRPWITVTAAKGGRPGADNLIAGNQATGFKTRGPFRIDPAVTLAVVNVRAELPVAAAEGRLEFDEAIGARRVEVVPGPGGAGGVGGLGPRAA